MQNPKNPVQNPLSILFCTKFAQNLKKNSFANIMSRAQAKSESGSFILLLLSFIGVIYFIFRVYSDEHTSYQVRSAKKEVLSNLTSFQNLEDASIGSLIYLYKNESLEIDPKNELYDKEFNIRFEKSLKYKRVVEYCQWEEIITYTTHKDSDGNEYSIEHVNYVKGWHSIPLLSAHFRQPFKHNNPMRFPYTDSLQNVEHSRIGNSNIILKESFIHKSKWWTLFNANNEQMEDFSMSEAHLKHGFVLIQDGWFYSSFNPSTLNSVCYFCFQFPLSSPN